jgi:integrative and conjugative element protein (TIGR02256 family)
MNFKLGGPQKYLVFSEEVLRHFERQRQRGMFSKEAGGQLFASYSGDSIVIAIATGPYPSDRRSRYRFTPDPVRAQQDIDTHFRQRRHFIGNWHTHPEEVPSPSPTDVKNTRRRFVESDHALEAFVLVIVGLAPFPRGLYVSLLDAIRLNVLAHCSEESISNTCPLYQPAVQARSLAGMAGTGSSKKVARRRKPPMQSSF